MSSGPATIICGVTCACAPANKTPAIEPTIEPCSAKESCLYKGSCSCAPGACAASQAKQKCPTALAGECSCATGQCVRADSMRAACGNAKAGTCSCVPGTCAEAATVAGADPATVPQA